VPACSSSGEILRELKLISDVLHDVFLRLRVVFTLQLATCWITSMPLISHPCRSAMHSRAVDWLPLRHRVQELPPGPPPSWQCSPHPVFRAPGSKVPEDGKCTVTFSDCSVLFKRASSTTLRAQSTVGRLIARGKKFHTPTYSLPMTHVSYS
jgi:hypothetical protein